METEQHRLLFLFLTILNEMEESLKKIRCDQTEEIEKRINRLHKEALQLDGEITDMLD